MSSRITFKARNIADIVRKQALPLTGSKYDYNQLVDAIGDSKVVMPLLQGTA